MTRLRKGKDGYILGKRGKEKKRDDVRAGS